MRHPRDTVALDTHTIGRSATSPRAALARLRADHRMLVARGAIVDAVRLAWIAALVGEVGQ